MDPKPQPEAQPSRPSRPVRDGLGFFGNFLKNPTSVGAVLPSSRYLSRALVGDLSHLQEGDLVLEYGPGTGPMTSVIHDRLPRGAHAHTSDTGRVDAHLPPHHLHTPSHTPCLHNTPGP